MKIEMTSLSLLELAAICIKEHKKFYNDNNRRWDKGDAIWIQRNYYDGSVSIAYENGQWFHYWSYSGGLTWD